ncbi:hypothetical protein ACQV5M_21725, partial [Leptospira sp. SA-E8]|uniref:hypothetical protein n=1 Tax=Leptospira sp. SA-E8 TaxID=3422259 RepID=UPI003EC01EFB
IEVLKFQQPILPGMQVELRLQWKAGPDGGGTLDFSYRGAPGPDGALHSSGRLVYAAPGKSV